jgi:hypothetical protein
MGLAITAAYGHDVKTVEQVLQTLVYLPPHRSEEHVQHFCADKGHDSKEVRRLIGLLGYEDHIISRSRRSRH